MRLTAKRNACPLCGSREQSRHKADDSLLVCTGCGECLYPRELVRVATPISRRRYEAAQ